MHCHHSAQENFLILPRTNQSFQKYAVFQKRGKVSKIEFAFTNKRN